MTPNHKIFGAAFVIAAGCFGCIGTVDGGSESTESTGKLGQGLTVFTKDPEHGLTGMFVEDGKTVFFETAREVVKDPPADFTQFDSEGTPIAISVRYSDAEGRSIYLATAGDATPEGWKEDESQAIPLEALRHREALLDVMVHAGQALETAQVPPVMALELQYAVQIPKLIPPPELRREKAPEEDILAAKQAAYSNTGYYRQSFHIRRNDAIVEGGHICTWWDNQYLDTNGYYYYYNRYDNADHGQGKTHEQGYCKNLSATSSCSSYSVKRAGTSGTTHCGTVYNVLICASGIYQSHNCQSDSWKQRRKVMDDVFDDSQCDCPRVNGLGC
jgi:hypothetical protein